MARRATTSNDIRTLEAHFSHWKSERGLGLPHDINAFTYYSIEQVLKQSAMSDEDILFGITDGDGDGGLDAVYFSVDGIPVSSEEAIIRLKDDRRNSPIVRVTLFQIKEGNAGFQENELNKILLILPHLLGLDELDEATLRLSYSTAILQKFKFFRDLYDAVITKIPLVELAVHYVIKREVEPDKKALQVAKRIESECTSLISQSRTSVCFENPKAILSYIRATTACTKILEFSEQPMSADGQYVGIVKLSEFHSFITDNNGAEISSFYDRNVRGHLGDRAGVNKRIRESLAESNSAVDFWLLNNGITIICNDSQLSSRKLSVTDPQIVNGLQTSKAIVDHFRGKDNLQDSRSVLVRVIKSTDDALYDRIILATNSQNTMKPGALRATDDVQHQIETVFLSRGYFYERRVGHYKDLGKPAAKIVSTTELTQAVLALFNHRPDDARARPADYLKHDGPYNKVFSKQTPVDLYLACVLIVRLVSSAIKNKSSDRGERFNLVFYVSYAYAALCSQNLRPNAENILGIGTQAIDASIFDQCWKLCHSEFVARGATDSVAKGSELLPAIEGRIKACIDNSP